MKLAKKTGEKNVLLKIMIFFKSPAIVPSSLPRPVSNGWKPSRGRPDRLKYRSNSSCCWRVWTLTQVPWKGLRIEHSIPWIEIPQGGRQLSFGCKDTELHGWFPVSLAKWTWNICNLQKSTGWRTRQNKGIKKVGKQSTLWENEVELLWFNDFTKLKILILLKSMNFF